MFYLCGCVHYILSALHFYYKERGEKETESNVVFYQ